MRDVFPCDTSPCRYNSATGDRRPATGDRRPATGGGGEFNSDWTPGSTTFRVDGAVTIQIADDNDRLGGWWCWMDGPSATYTWSVNGTTLTLAPVGGNDACSIRGYIWTGTWTRVG